jgi:hypothetical protein
MSANVPTHFQPCVLSPGAMITLAKRQGKGKREAQETN